MININNETGNTNEVRICVETMITELNISIAGVDAKINARIKDSLKRKNKLSIADLKAIKADLNVAKEYLYICLTKFSISNVKLEIAKANFEKAKVQIEDVKEEFAASWPTLNR